MNYKKEIEKVLDLLKKLSIGRDQAEREMGYSENYIDQTLSKGGNKKFFEHIQMYYHRMLQIATANEGNAKSNTYLESRRNKKNNNVKPGIAVYESAPATLTTTEVYRDEKQEDPDFWITIPFLRDCDYGCRAKGDSMHPIIRTNALVIGKRVFDFSVIIFGEIYIIKTKNNIETVKYIHPHPDNADIVLLVPYNDKAKTTPIRKEDILELHEAKAVFNNL